MIIEGVIYFSDSLQKHFIKECENCLLWENGYFISTKLTPDTKVENIFALGVNFIGARGLQCLNVADLDAFDINHHIGQLRAGNKVDNFPIGSFFDEAKGALFLSRDIFGTIPIYYIHISGSFVAFSTSLVSLLKIPIVRPFLELDLERIATYCRIRGDQASGYSSSTFYKNIKTVLPGHVIEISAKNSTTQPYISFNPAKWNGIRSKEDYSQIFKKILFDSVTRTFCITNKPIASHLSGGLDSSSVSAVAKAIDPEIDLHTLYLDTKTKFSDEIEYARQVALQIDSIHHEVTPLQEDFQLTSLYTSVYGHPECMVVSPSSQGTLMDHASKLGCKTLLMGHDGDSIVGTGLEILTETFIARNWSMLKELIVKRAPYASLDRMIPNWSSLNSSERLETYTKHLVLNKFFEQSRKLAVLETGKLLLTVSRNMNVPLTAFCKEFVKRSVKKIFRPKALAITIMTSDILKKSAKKTENLSDILRGNLPKQYKVWFDDVFNAQALVSNEEFFALGNYYGLENKFPLYNKELFELCISVPLEIKFGRGIGREHFREAMQGLLPEEVRSRPDKANFSLYGREAALRLYHQSKEFMKDEGNLVWEFIDRQKYVESVKIMTDENASESSHTLSKFHVTRAISLAIWFDWLKKNDLLLKTS